MTQYDTLKSGISYYTSRVQYAITSDAWGTWTYNSQTNYWGQQQTITNRNSNGMLVYVGSTLPDYPSGTYSSLNFQYLNMTGSYTSSSSYSHSQGTTRTEIYTTTVSSNTLELQLFPRNYASNYDRLVTYNKYSSLTTRENAYNFSVTDMTMLYSLKSTNYNNYGTQRVETRLVSMYRLTQTTGTSYFTCSSTSATSYLTRSSTSSTEYKTRVSTSGYSGVSSSSSQSSGWL